MKHGFLPRLGTFFILIGCVLLILFIASVFAKEFSLPYLVLTIGAIFLGSTLRKAAAPVEPRRFSSIRRLSQRSRKQIDKEPNEEETNQ